MGQFSLYISKRIAIAGVGDPHLRFRHRFRSNLAGALFQSKAVVVCVFNQVTLILLATASDGHRCDSLVFTFGSRNCCSNTKFLQKFEILFSL